MIRRAHILIAAVTVWLLAFAPAASAHILLENAAPRGDGTVQLTFTFDHSCDDSPTTALSIGLPDGAEVVETSGPDGWIGTIGEAGTVEFNGPGIGDKSGEQFVVVASLRGSVGQTLLFPTEQRCENGDGYSWTDESESEERPAPRLVATAAVLSDLAAPPAAVGGDGASATEAAVALGVLAALAFMLSPFVLRPFRRGQRR